MLGMYEQRGILEFDYMGDQAGNNWIGRIVIFDEMELAYPNVVRMALGRVGRGTKLIGCGDNGQTVMSRGSYVDLNENNNGLARLVELYPGEYNYAHIRFQKAFRSAVAELADRMQ